MCELLARMIFLSTGFKASHQNNPYAVSYGTQVWTQTWPFMFNALCIINILKYKLHLYYSFRQEQGPTSVRVGLIILIFVTVSLGFFFPFVDCDINLNHKNIEIVNKWIQTFYLLFLSAVSLIVAKKLAKQLQMANQEEISKRLYFLEGVIQLILVVRLFTSWAQFSFYETTNQTLIISLMFFSFFLSELFPLFLVVCGIYVQVDWKKVKEANFEH